MGRGPEVTLAPARARIPQLDGLRGIAILSVFAGHAALFGPEGAESGTVRTFLSHNAGTGVDLFFVLSGFLITGILLDLKGERSYFRTFYLRRTLRIFPLYYATLIAVTILKAVWDPLESTCRHASLSIL